MASQSTITTTATFIVGTIIDDMVNSVVATVYLNGCPAPLQLVLWSGQAYQAIGNWTTAQALAQITALLNAGTAGN